MGENFWAREDAVMEWFTDWTIKEGRLHEQVDLQEIDLDGKLTKKEIEEVKKIINYDELKIDSLFHTQDKFMEFINSDYKYANETFMLWKWKGIIDLQSQLNEKMWLEIATDWDFSKKTFLTLIKFQKENNLTIDWLIWDQTYKALFW